MAKKQKELQHLGFLGIFKESFNIIFSQPKIFIQITLFFILPISCIAISTNIGLGYYLDHAADLSANYFNYTLLGTSTNLPTPPYNETPKSNGLSWKAAFHGICSLAYSTLSFVFFLISVSMTAYTVICLKTGKDISFRKAVSIVPRVRKQVTRTLLCLMGINTVIFLVFILVFPLIMIGFARLVISSKTFSHKLIFGVLLAIGGLIFFLLYVVVIFYTEFIWVLGEIVCVLEKISGIEALKRSKTLVKGKMGTTICVCLGMYLCTIPSTMLFKRMRNTNEGKVWEKNCYGILGLVFSSFSSIFDLVVSTVLYLMCKSYHNEPIHKLSSIGYMELSHGDHFHLNEMIDELVEDLGV